MKYSLAKIFVDLSSSFFVKGLPEKPEELEDILFIKYLVVYKRWLKMNKSEQELIKTSFLSRVKPKATLWYVMLIRKLPNTKKTKKKHTK